MSVVPESILLWGRAAVFMAGVSVFYRRTIAYTILEQGLIGTMCATVLYTQLVAIQKGIGAALGAGDYLYIVPLMWGLLYFSVFSRRLVNLFRIVAAITLAVSYGLNVPMIYKTVFTAMKGYATITGATLLAQFLDGLMAILFFLGLIYFVFGSRFERPLRIPRMLGLYVIYILCGLMTAAVFTRNTDSVIGMLYDQARSPSIIVLGIGVLIILIDLWRTGRLVMPGLEKKAPA